MLQCSFDASLVSRQLYSFHCCFLKLVAGPRGADLAQISRRYDRTMGVPPRFLRRRLLTMLRGVQAVTSWDAYFDSICLSRVSPEMLQRLWVGSVRASLAKGYHSASTNFASIQRRGVSDILLRGKSYPRVVLCIDCSGSMEATFRESDGRYVSRLDFVKRELEHVFCEKLTHRQQFTVIKFSTRATMWSKGLQQATSANLDSAVKYVHGWNADGGTNLEAALDLAFAVEKVQAVFLLSDGEVEDSEAIVERARRLSRNGEIHCHTTTFYAPASGQAMLEQIAKATNGSYFKFGEGE